MSESDTKVKGKTALVTGGARRIGRAITLRLAEAGINVVIHCNTSGREAEEVAALARKQGVEAWTVRADLSIIDEVESIFPRLRGDTGPVDYLINNASVFTKSHLTELETDELFRTLTVNAVAPLILANNFVRQTDTGAIVNILDSRILRFDLDHASYQLSKTMLNTLTGMMAIEYAPRFRVNAVAPGMILPPADRDETFLEKQHGAALIRNRDRLADVTEAVLFLLSHGFVTGEVIFVDGGQNLKRSAIKEHTDEL